YQYNWGTGFHVWLPSESEMDWLSEQYPNTFDKYYRPKFEYWKKLEEAGTPFLNTSLPCLCQVCQLPTAFSEPGDPTLAMHRESRYLGEVFHLCSDGCKDIFEGEPEKYAQARLPVQQLLQGNMGGPEIADVIRFWGFEPGRDGGLYA